jgi:hypothetical protein
MAACRGYLENFNVYRIGVPSQYKREVLHKFCRNFRAGQKDVQPGLMIPVEQRER